MPRAEREQQMLKAAAKLFGARGFHAASMDEIAESVGITKPMLYAYFGSKEGLYAATVNQAGLHLVSSVEALFAEPDPVQRLYAGAEMLLRFIERYRDSWAVLFQEGGAVNSQVAVFRQQIAVAGALTLASLAPVGESPQSAQNRAAPYIHLLLGGGEGMARWWISQQQVSFETVSSLMRAQVDQAIRHYQTAAP
jgi:AcrR family transcriptional regulator